MIRLGGEFREFIERQNLPQNSKDALIENAQKILHRTDLLSGEESENCQLVVGEVQSGKTMSFTSLIALAHENSFPLVVVLAGTKDQLLSQTADRLMKDLRADGSGGANPWVMLEKPKKKERHENIQKIQQALNIWGEVDAPDSFKPTVVISTLKNKTSIDEVAEMIMSLNSRFEIGKFPVLIVDDEGDQAGLNLSWAAGEESTVYAAIGRLRKCFTRHSYVMYTATPQGPLLINIQDNLSPKYVTLLKSGDDYLGGEELFITSKNFTKIIPSSENQQVFDTHSGAPIPKSLKQALAYFLLSLHLSQNRNFPKPVSMLIHPSAKKELHLIYEKWVNNVLSSWEAILRDPLENVYQNEKSDFFLPAEIEIQRSVKLPVDWELDKVLQELRWWISKIEVRVINTDRSNFKPNEWVSKAGWILIGGNKLERGFTIENLAVTYMPRSTGGGNVDVIQQRGRFFGYKRKYADILRGWFFQDHVDAYVHYVDHEKSIREQLATIDDGNSKLSEWRRRFLLDPTYNPVRRQVISLGISHRRLTIFKQHMLFDPQLVNSQPNLQSQLQKFSVGLNPFPQDLRIGYKNAYTSLSINDALELLVDWPMAPENRAELDDTIWALRTLVDEDALTHATLVFMDWDMDKKEQRVRERSMLGQKADASRTPEKQSIANIFQGRSPKSEGNYPGDQAMIIDGSLTIQVHKVKPFYELQPKPIVFALGLIVPPNFLGFISEVSS